MDIHNQLYFAQLQISGVKSPANRQGSIADLIRGMAEDLNRLNPRTLADGHKEIIFIIRDKPFSSHKESLDEQNKIADVELALESANNFNHGPVDKESFEEYYERMVSLGLNIETSRFLACDWFERPQNPELVNWLADPKAVRFRELNTRNEAFESAAPTEYTTLCHYVVSTYPNMIANLTFRKA